MCHIKLIRISTPSYCKCSKYCTICNAHNHQRTCVASVAEVIEMNNLPSANNLNGNILQLTEIKVNIVHRIQDIYDFVMWCILCQLGPFLLAQ